MEYYKNLLLRTSISNKLIVFGLVMASSAIAWLVIQLTNNDPINIFDWIFFIVFGINGLFNGLKGFGYSMQYIFGKSFVKVNESLIIVKASAFEPENKADWKTIKQIEYKATRFRLTKIDETEQRLCMRKLNEDVVNEMKIEVEKMAKRKDIAYYTVNQ